MRYVRVIGLVVLAVAVLALALPLVIGPRVTSETTAASSGPTTVSVARGHIESTVTATGNVEPARQATVGFAASGRIVEVLVSEGDRVEAGQVLARLDTAAAERQVARAEASLASAEARLAQAERPATSAEVAAAQAALDAARANLNRLTQGPSAQDLENARLNLETAKNQLWSAQAQRDATGGNPVARDADRDATNAQVNIAELNVQKAELALQALQDPPRAADLASARSQVAQAEAQLDNVRERPRAEDVAVVQAQVSEAVLSVEQARAALDDYTLRAPVAGTVTALSLRAGEWTGAGAMVAVSSTDDLVVRVNVDELDVAQITAGQVTRLTLEALPNQTLEGSVRYVAPDAVRVSGAVAYRVEVRFGAGEYPVRSGMTANVEIVTAAATDALLVPSRAVTSDRSTGRSYVTPRTSEGCGEPIEVRLAIRDGQQVQVLDGLTEGDALCLPDLPTSGQVPSLPGFGMFGGARQ